MFTLDFHSYPIEKMFFTRDETLLFKERKEITPFHFPYIHMTLGEATCTLVLGVLGWMTK
jgi:hypothetical protein